MIKLTARQQQILDLIRDQIEETGYPPTRAEISRTLGFKSANAAEDHLRALAKKGVIEIVAGTSRGIRLPEQQRGLPLVGRVAAGNPILAVENIDNYVEVPGSFFTPRADFFLSVQGMSMKDIGVLDGDLLAVHAQSEAKDNDIVVARVNDEVTVKRFEHKKPSEVLLHPENADFETIKVDLAIDDFAIEGLSVGVIRQNVN